MPPGDVKKLVLVIAGTALICIVAVAFVIFWFWAQMQDVAKYLPPNPSAVGVSITASYAKVFNQFAVRHFRFTAKGSADSAAAARLFEEQLNAAGWEKRSECSNGLHSSGVWRRKDKFGVDRHLVFAVEMLNEDTHEFAGSMVTEPYWPHKL